MKKGIIFQIIPSEGKGRVRNFYMSSLLLKFLGFFIFSLLILNVFLIYHFYNFQVDKNKLNFLLKENKNLYGKLKTVQIKNDSLMKKIEKITDRLNKLRKFANLEPFEEELLKMGKGGALMPEPKGEDLEERIDYMLNLANEFESKIGEIEEYVEKNKREFSHTPSIMPVNSGWITSRFGYRKDPFTGRKKLHEGIDISGNFGDPVFATADGKVIYAGWRRGYGLMVEIDHGNGYRTRYAHNSKLLVKIGQRVKRGDIIALMGKSGRTTGVHVHYEVRLFNKPVNPLNYIIPDHLYFD